MTLSTCTHIALNVSDLEKSVNFYTEIMGFETVHLDTTISGKGLENLVKYPKGAALRAITLKKENDPNGMIELIEWKAPAQQPKPVRKPGEIGVLLLSFRVDNEKLEDVIIRLEEKGVTLYSSTPNILELEGAGTAKAVVLEDPDGNLLELVEAWN